MSGTTNTIDVLLIVDADNLLSTGDVAGSVSLLVQRNLVDPNATGNQQDGGNELWFDVKRGDNVRWRATTLSRNFDTTALITDVIQGDPNQGGHYDGQISTPSYLPFYDVPVAYLEGTNPLKVGSNAVTVTVWQATAEKPGKLWYQIQFSLLNQETQQVGGPYIWDPYITVNN
ncbi:AidA/PixA family protein [Pseudomonas japonica]|uniref:Inclusion body protein n=1 Tax=Pseudomonas japonica TaxID=256466 RepID=A0A239FUJ4_9PSED|nr:AidA/PixA family protein [Pseudomonas japonica]SNS60551.1 Inclusion body protein [Pseudomonas japonica]